MTRAIAMVTVMAMVFTVFVLMDDISMFADHVSCRGKMYNSVYLSRYK